MATPPPTFASRLQSGAVAIFNNIFRGPSVAHSILFGAGLGLAIYPLQLSYLFVKTAWFDSEAIALASRKRYQDKQRCHEAELDAALKNAAMVDYVQEYDPVAARLPFQKLDPYYRF
ncbi:unnamed protein product [Vitrella brassicaformis CCMP3155]|uniref:Uncharacterized protein n=2 Tax=Vitrella brassicaformis TaxID=1169539 RepID=A0A0G4G2Z6_VITBC|nr:unnamed protein product [Vitrella brassicaformis CCMP3155]|eukprot:CEM22465.1 unnamed protein product [Vitrella brassicaformis CCMP3155]